MDSAGSQELELEQCKNNNHFPQKWPMMRPIVQDFLRVRKVTKLDWNKVTSDAAWICLWDDKEGADKLSNALQKEIKLSIDEVRERILVNEDELCLLRAYIKEWTNFFDVSEHFFKQFLKLEPYLKGNTKTNGIQGISITIANSEVRKLMLDTWNKEIFTKLKECLQRAAMKVVNSERNGELFDSNLITGVRQSYVNLCTDNKNHLAIYYADFEKPYLEATMDFYNAKCQEYFAVNGIRNYMAWADAKLKEEEERAKKYLETSNECTSMKRFMGVCVQVFVASFKDLMLAQAAEMIRDNETEKLALMFGLVDRITSSIDPILQNLETHIKEQGLADMKFSAETIVSDPEQYVQKLMDLFRRFSSLVENAFHNDSRFLMSRDKAYQTVVNDISIFNIKLPTKSRCVGAKTQPESKCPELLANFCDLLFRKSPLSKKMTSEEMRKKAEEIVLIMKYVTNKDVFMRYYKTHLARRLILQSSADSHMEEYMIQRLKEVGIPAEYTQTLQRMFQDIKVGLDFNEEFKDAYKEKNEFLSNAVNFNVLNSGVWARSSDRVPVTLPTEMAENIPHMEEYYTKRFSGRKLQWYHIMSNGTINFVNDVGKFELEVTTFQMAILFLWNDIPTEKISFESLRMSTELPENELKRALSSLIMNPKLRHQPLLCSPPVKNPKEFTNDTQFWVNQKFGLVKGGKLQKRGKMSLIGKLQLNSEANKKEDEDAIVELRKFRIQEAIVKIMKMRKTVKNAQLWTEVIAILKNQFVPSKAILKEQIEWLIENKYMKRDPMDLQTFIYLA